MSLLRLAPSLTLPLDAVTQTFGIVAIRGAGKTYTASVFAEELLKAKMQVVIIDPTGAWWGLRASADGKGPGYPVIVMGGNHGDVPLEEGSGEVVADFIVDEGVSVVLDTSLMRKAARDRFMTAFAEHLYYRKGQAGKNTPLHIINDEADQSAPQKPQPQQLRLLGAIEDWVRQGRIRGMGVTMVTQRPAVLNKNVLTQIETLVVLRTTSPQDRKAIDAWVEANATQEERDTVAASLASLPNGTAWFWSPGWLKTLKKVQVRARETFNSSATPKMGEKRIEPRQLAEVDLAKLKGQIAATIEKAKANDPAVLRRQLAESQAKLNALTSGVKSAPQAVKTKEVRVEIPTFKDGEIKRLEKSAAALGAVQAKLSEQAERVFGQVKEVASVAAQVQLALDRAWRIGSPAQAQMAARSDPMRLHAKVGQVMEIQKTESLAAIAQRGLKQIVHEASPELGDITPAKQKILDSLAFFAGIGRQRVDKYAVALLAGARPTSGAYKNNLGSLRSAGLINYPTPGEVELTQAGKDAARHPDNILTDAQLQSAVLEKVTPAQRRIVEYLIGVYPSPVAKDVLAQNIGAQATSGAFKNNLGALRTLGVIDYPNPGSVKATGLLFLEAR